MNYQRLLIILTTSVLTFGCANTLPKYQVKPSIVAETDVQKNNEPVPSTDKPKQQGLAFKTLTSLGANFDIRDRPLQTQVNFSEQTELTFAVENMPLVEFIHYVFGDILKTNYVVHNDLQQRNAPVTLNFQQTISQKQVFLASSEILNNQEIAISAKDNVFYLLPMDNNDNQRVDIGVGQQITDIPVTPGQILQIIPLTFGAPVNLNSLLSQLTQAKLTIDYQKAVIFARGTREQIQQIVEVIQLLDIPPNKGKHVGLIKLTYLTTKEFSEQIVELLGGEGIQVGVGQVLQRNVTLIPLETIGRVAVFSINQGFLDRIRYWQQQIDKPSESNEKRYFIYQPEFARAKDLGDSLAPLFGGNTNSNRQNNNNSRRDTQSALANRIETLAPVNAPVRVGNPTADLSMVVDERTNNLIFYSTGKEYQSVLPLIKRMDTLPKQVFLEAVVAEVTLSDQFRFGVEFALAQQGNFGASTSGAFVDNFGGLALGWASTNDSVDANFFKGNTLVNILSNPTLLVRDGVTATNTVGNEIPILTSTTADPLDGSTFERTNFERRQTGITFSVTPTINAQGVVIMDIDIDISNQLNTTVDNQVLFNRKLTTEVVANSGQTIILGGLISENTTSGEQQVPLLGDIPLIGHLFKSKNNDSDKTELILLITPKIIDDTNQWQQIKNNFRLGLENIEF